MLVCCECCVLSGRGLCDQLITRPEESYRLWCVVVCDLENLVNEEAMTRVRSQRHKKKIILARDGLQYQIIMKVIHKGHATLWEKRNSQKSHFIHAVLHFVS
jgi:hypothetical protein